MSRNFPEQAKPAEVNHSLSGVVVDLDNTIALHSPGLDYKDAAPNEPLIERLRELQSKSIPVVIHTSRGMRSREGNTDRIRLEVVPGILQWLKIHNVPFNELVVGKPWPGPSGLYIDDRAIRPNECVSSSWEHLLALVGSSWKQRQSS